MKFPMGHDIFKSLRSIEGLKYLKSTVRRSLDRPGFRTLLSKIEILNANSAIRDLWLKEYIPKQGDLIVDIGAGVGWEAIAFATCVAPEGKVYAIEAHPDTFGKLKENVSCSKKQNVICKHTAISNQDGTLYIETGENHLANSTQTTLENNDVTPVESITLDTFCASSKIDRINFLKMNIEGAEIEAIAGMEKSISIIESLCVSCHDFRGSEDPRFCTKAEIIEFLRDHGFRLSFREDDYRPYVRDQVYAFR